MIGNLPPGLVMLLGAVVLLFVKGRLRSTLAIVIPIVSLVHMIVLGVGTRLELEAFGQTLVLMRIDELSFVFGIIFHLAAIMGAVFAFHLRDPLQQVSGAAYAASTIGAVLAGDLLTLFIFWELVALTSTGLVVARRNRESYHAGMRYLIVQIVSGLLLAAGAALRYQETGSLAFEAMALDSASSWLIFLAFGLKCGWPLLHGWIVEGYPAATATGTIYLSAFTTKLAVYTLARGFPGAEPLIWIGASMALFPIFYAVIENDLRRVLCYSMINQIGYMVCGIGIGTELAINGAAAHAFCHIVYKSLLFMSMGAVIHRTGRINGTDLGGLHRTMPWTTGFCMVGAASISAFPFTSGFISKSMIVTAAALATFPGHDVVWLILLFASAGVFHHAGIKIPFFAFFGHDSGMRPREAPWNMLLAMGMAAFLCIGLGCYPQPLYDLLPYAVDYVPYTAAHVVTQLQILTWSALAFVVLMVTRIYPPELRSVNVDADWLYRRGGPAFKRLVEGPLMAFLGGISRFAHETVPQALWYVAKNPPGAMRLVFDRLRLAGSSLVAPLESVDRHRVALLRDRARYEATPAGTPWPIGTVVLYAAVLFLVVLVVFL